MQLHKRQSARKLTASTIEAIRKRSSVITAEMKCSIHQKRAVVKIEGKNLEDLKVLIDGCCDVFVRRVREALRKAL